MSEIDAIIFLIVTSPVLFMCAFTDLKFMTISNRANIVLAVIFLVLGLFLIPLPEYGIRVLQLVAVLVVGFFMTTFGLIGGGDAKLLAACAPYVALTHATNFGMMLCVFTLAAVLAHKLLARIPKFRNEVGDWVSWQKHRNFPFGVPISATLFVYLFLVTGIG